jgi:hypothetical protein
MKTVAPLLIAVLLAMSPLAAPGHPFHGNVTPITREDASLVGERMVNLLVDSNKLPASWRERQPAEIATRATPAGSVWVVRYENPDEPDRAKRTIYIFIDEFGNYLGGNYSGKM